MIFLFSSTFLLAFFLSFRHLCQYLFGHTLIYQFGLCRVVEREA